MTHYIGFEERLLGGKESFLSRNRHHSIVIRAHPPMGKKENVFRSPIPVLADGAVFFPYVVVLWPHIIFTSVSKACFQFFFRCVATASVQTLIMYRKVSMSCIPV